MEPEAVVGFGREQDMIITRLIKSPHGRSALLLLLALLVASIGFFLWTISRETRLYLFLGVAALVLLIGCLTVFPDSFIREDFRAAERPVDITKLVEARNSLRGTLINALAGILLIFGATFAWQQLVTMREGQLSSEFTSATALLGSADSAVRMSASTALGQLAKASPSHERAIYSILANFVRVHSATGDADRVNCDRAHREIASLLLCAPDVQAALSALGGRPTILSDGARLTVGLRDANLQGALLGGSNFARSDLSGTNLDYMDARSAPLDPT